MLRERSEVHTYIICTYEATLECPGLSISLSTQTEKKGGGGGGEACLQPNMAITTLNGCTTPALLEPIVAATYY